MRLRTFVLVFVLVLTGGLATISWVYRSEFRGWMSDANLSWREGIIRERGIMVPMRDGVQLSTDIYKPVDANSKLPTILLRTTYGGTTFQTNKYFAKNGYAVVVQTVRGRYQSEGNYESPHHYSRRDGYDTISWIVQQPWSNGKVGTFGCSFLGENQIMLAAERHPNHIAMIVGGAGGAIGTAKDSYGYFGVYENGVLNLASALGWFTAEGTTENNFPETPADYAEAMRTKIGELPVADLAKKMVPYKTGFDDIVDRDLRDPWWKREGYIAKGDRFASAALHVNSWYDQTILDTFRLAEFMFENADHPRAKHQHLLIDAGVHCSVGQLKDGKVSAGEMSFEYHNPGFSDIYVRWLDYWLKDKKVELPASISYFLIHGNKWLNSESWPPQNVEWQRHYLNAAGNLTAQAEEQTHKLEFVYDPMNPVPTRGGPICCTYRKEDIAGAVDQAPLLTRDDVLNFTSEPLERTLDLVGNAKVRLSVSSTAVDTDFTAKLVDVWPNGKIYNLQDGVARLRYRKGIAQPELAEPGTVYEVEIELRPIAYRFRAGHRIGVHVSSSNFPRLARNLNTGADEYTDSRYELATNVVYLGGKNISWIDLPILPAADAGTP